MAEQTNIEWCDATLNLWWGCTKVSEGCKHCYAEAFSDQRYQKGAWGPKGKRIESKSWRSTLNKISKQAKAEGRRLKVFCQSMSDTFEGPETCGGVDSENWRLIQRLQDELFAEILNHPELDFLLLTKRPENVHAAVHRHDEPDGSGGGNFWDWPNNVWLGTSVEDQKTADERILHLLSIPAKVRFLSCEPLLGPVDLAYTCFNGADSFGSMPGIHWVIAGGESGRNARPMHPDWARSLRDQCVAAGVPFFFKQWGEWVSEMHDAADPHTQATSDQFVKHVAGDYLGVYMCRVGKKSAGRLLDGREWSQFPEVVRC